MSNAPLENLLARRDALENLISRIDVWLLVFGILVVIGVAGESIFGIRAWWNNRQLHNVQQSIDDLRQAETSRFNKEAADANREAGLAHKAAGEANERAANAQKQAAESNKIAEEERIERLKLQSSMQPRRLTAEQKDKLTALLKPFSSLPIILEWTTSGAQESVDLASDMAAAITNAGIAIPNRNILMDQYVVGVAIRFGDERRAEAELIAGFFVEAGLSPKPVQAEPRTEPKDLVIVIGSKPSR